MINLDFYLLHIGMGNRRILLPNKTKKAINKISKDYKNYLKN